MSPEVGGRPPADGVLTAHFRQTSSRCHRKTVSGVNTRTLRRHDVCVRWLRALSLAMQSASPTAWGASDASGSAAGCAVAGAGPGSRDPWREWAGGRGGRGQAAGAEAGPTAHRSWRVSQCAEGWTSYRAYQIGEAADADTIRPFEIRPRFLRPTGEMKQGQANSGAWPNPTWTWRPRFTALSLLLLSLSVLWHDYLTTPLRRHRGVHLFSTRRQTLGPAVKTRDDPSGPDRR